MKVALIGATGFVVFAILRSIEQGQNVTKGVI